MLRDARLWQPFEYYVAVVIDRGIRREIPASLSPATISRLQ